MSDDDDARRARAAQLLGGPELARLRMRLRARYRRERAPDEITLDSLEVHERRALERVLGRTVSDARSMRVRISDLDSTLRAAGIAADLRAALELLDGALGPDSRERRDRELAWEAALREPGHAALSRLLGERPERGLLKRLAAGDPQRASALLEQARRVLERLPAAGVPIARLAADTLGDAHGLDVGRPVATLVLRALGRSPLASAATAGDGDELAASPQAPHGASVDEFARESGDLERARDQWARVGVSVNELARPVLALGLRAGRGLAPLANAAAERGEPIHLSLRALLREAHAWQVATRAVYVCENPTIVALAADELGSACPPLVCTDGMPGAAQRTLLAQLRGSGARLAYHGDFDWPGLAVGNFVLREFDAWPWRFAADDYLAACSALGPLDTLDSSALLRGGGVSAAWDPQLAPAMTACGRAVHEEAVAAVLLDELRGDARAPSSGGR